ncbi:peptide methionine sulfoxide reductase msrB/msrA [Plectosphaerella plurivora]|uniref:peptide-methionine (S)-S-oxide reductase n=1 Tax=Plectosphaerella plurivora TaxID=936078 RepID=A0A9P9A7Q8_9PEZI|nr:peptide methionine sulfoxide reductase msrB/msrA [Plectosphaerella plurivora]
MAFTMPSFLARLARPFTTTSTLSLAAPATSDFPGSKTATIAAGCFWGVEHVYRKQFGGGKGLLDARVGYIGGDSEHPSYREVCTGRTGHAEALQVIYDPAKVSYAQLLDLFYRMHDPTTANRQGPDVGTQYRSGIYFHDAEQEAVARDITRKANEQWYEGKIATEIVPAGKWWNAEDYHQEYLHKNPSGYECPSHFVRTFKPLE